MSSRARRDRLVINWLLPGVNLSGGTKSNRLLAEAMVRRGHTVRLIYPRTRRPWPSARHPRRWMSRFASELQVRGKQRHHMESSTAELLPVRQRPVPGDVVPDADFAIATWWETRYWIERWPRSKGQRVYMIRGHELHGGDPGQVSRTYTMSGQKFVISRWLQRVMAESYGDPDAVLVHNGVDRAQFDAPPRARSPVPTVGMLYGSAEWKGAQTAFDAVRRAQQRMPGIRVIAFGTRRPPRGSRLPANLEFHLRPPQRELAGLYRRCDCWLVSSSAEGFGMPGLEAAACRCPIVSTRCGGPEDYVEEGVNGYLVGVGDSAAMARQLLDVLRCGERQWCRMSEASYEISSRFDWNRSAEIMEATLMSLRRGTRPSGGAADATVPDSAGIVG